MEGPKARQDCKADKDQRKGPHLKIWRERIFCQFKQAHAPGTRDDESRDEADQDHRTADKRIERQFHRAILPPSGAPNRDEEILWNNREFVEGEEQKKIEAQEYAINSADQSEIKCEEFLGASLDVPGKKNSRDGGQAGQQNQSQADSIGGEVIFDPERRNP